MALCAESSVFGERGRDLGALEQHPPNVLVRRAVELLQRLVIGRVELPQIECPSLAPKDPTDEHNLDHVDKFNFLFIMLWIQVWSTVSSVEEP